VSYSKTYEYKDLVIWTETQILWARETSFDVGHVYTFNFKFTIPDFAPPTSVLNLQEGQEEIPFCSISYHIDAFITADDEEYPIVTKSKNIDVFGLNPTHWSELLKDSYPIEKEMLRDHIFFVKQGTLICKVNLEKSYFYIGEKSHFQYNHN